MRKTKDYNVLRESLGWVINQANHCWQRPDGFNHFYIGGHNNNVLGINPALVGRE